MKFYSIIRGNHYLLGNCSEVDMAKRTYNAYVADWPDEEFALYEFDIEGNKIVEIERHKPQKYSTYEYCICENCQKEIRHGESIYCLDLPGCPFDVVFCSKQCLIDRIAEISPNDERYEEFENWIVKKIPE